MKDMNFARIKDGNYEKFQALLDNNMIPWPCYVYDELAKKLIWVNKDKTWNYIGAEEQTFTILEGTSEVPVRIEELTDGMYIIKGAYRIKNTDVEYNAKSPIMALVEVSGGVVNATIYTSNGSTIYKIEGDTTTIDKTVTEQTVVGVVQTQVQEQVPGIIQEVAPEIIESNITTATDEQIDEIIDNLFPQDSEGGE